MLKECRLAMGITTDAYDAELCDLMDAGARDLRIAGIVLPGRVSFSVVSTTTGTGADAVTTTYMQDDSDMEDPLVRRAIITYVRMNFKSPSDYDRLRESYETQKCQLMHADGYTDYFGGDGE